MTNIKSMLGKVVKNVQVQPGFFDLELYAPEVAKTAKPGAFVMVRPNQSTSPLLGRPLGIYDTNPADGTISLLYAVKGEGTKLLALANQDDELPLVAPLGRTFTIDPKAKKVVVVAGGVGIAPLYPLIKELNKLGIKTQVLLGAATAKAVLAMDKLATQGCEISIFTDDGSMGQKGYPTDLLPSLLEAEKISQVFTCGPHIMMQKTAEIAAAAKVPCQVSLEERMGCGIGVCMGCVCHHKDQEGNEGLVRVCYEGPVFDAQEVF